MPKSLLPPLKPRPATYDSVTKAKHPTIAPRKRSYAGPFVFVNSSENPEREEERRGNRKMVKRWAMLNRTNHNHSPSSHKGKCRVVIWDLATLEETEDPETTSMRQLSLTPDESTMNDFNHVDISLQPLSASLNDPFRDLPIKVDAHTRDLLNFFLDGGGDGSLMTQARTDNFKRSTWPTVSKSKAALYSLISLLELSPEVPVKSSKDSFFTSNFSAAITTTSELLKQVNKPVSPEVFCCTNYLIWIAHYIGDKQALSAHGMGLAALVSRQWDVFSRTPFIRGGVVFWNHPHNEGDIIPELTIPAGAYKHDRFSVLRKTGFITLRDKGYLSDAFLGCIPDLLHMDGLLTLAKTGNLSVANAKELLSFMWYNSRMLHATQYGSLSELEDCVRQATIIYLYANIFTDPTNEIAWLAPQIQEKLLNVDVDCLMVDCPQVLLWLSLVVGSFSSGQVREWFFYLLVRARRVLSSKSFHQAVVDYAEQDFLWSRSLDSGAEKLWEDSTWYSYGLTTRYGQDDAEAHRVLCQCHNIHMNHPETKVASCVNALNIKHQRLTHDIGGFKTELH